jgi:hypothetical protein
LASRALYRTALARELLPGLPGSAIERMGQRTTSFAEAFAIAGEERLSDALPRTARPRCTSWTR